MSQLPLGTAWSGRSSRLFPSPAAGPRPKSPCGSAGRAPSSARPGTILADGESETSPGRDGASCHRNSCSPSGPPLPSARTARADRQRAMISPLVRSRASPPATAGVRGPLATGRGPPPAAPLRSPPARRGPRGRCRIRRRAPYLQWAGVASSASGSSSISPRRSVPGNRISRLGPPAGRDRRLPAARS